MIRAAATLIQRYSHVNWALADQAMVSGVNFLTGILLARYLGIDEFGRFTLVWMSVLFVNSIQHAMISFPMMSIGPKQPEAETPAYFGAIIVQQTIFSCLVFMLFLGGVNWAGVLFPEWNVNGLALPLAFAALTFQFQDFLRRYFFTRSRANAAFANDAIRYLGQIVVLLWLFISFKDEMNTAKVLWVIAIMAAIAAIIGGFFVEPIQVSAKVLRSTTIRHWHFSKWLTGSALMQWTTGNLFIIAAGAFLGATAVGALRAAQNLMGVVHILFMGLENIVPVKAAGDYHSKGKQALIDYLKRVTLFGGGATAIISIVAAVAPNFWLGLVFGDQYIGYGYLLSWWAGIYLVIFMGLPISGGLKALEQSKIIFKAYLWTTLFSVLAAYPMTVYMGLNGVLAGVATINVVQLIILWFGLKNKLA